MTDDVWDAGGAIRRHLHALVGERSPLGDPGALRRAEAHAERVFRESGLETRREPIAASKGAWHNVVAEAGAAPGAPLLVVGAHVDAVEGTPGADDNASGAAALLALAERLGAAARAPRRVAVRLVAFNLEEWGMLGSLEHAEALRAAGREVAGMISLEMIGYVDPRPGSQRYPPGMGIGRRKAGDFISVVGDLASRALVRDVAAALEAGGLPVETAAIPRTAAHLVGAGLSDHSSFWRCGYRAVMVGDTAFYRNPHYHAASDALETLSLPFLEKVARGLAAFLDALG
jgi:Zn-dependent M28 family amino/carboxypeptidase